MAETQAVPTAPAATPAIPGQSATQQAIDAKVQEAPKPPELFDIKINGRPQRLTREQLIAKASLAEGAHERFEKASQIEKSNHQFEETMKTDPVRAFLERGKALGLSRDQVQRAFENWYNEEVIKPSTMNEDQRRARELESQLKTEREEKEVLAKHKEEQERMQYDTVAREQVQKDIIGALDTAGMPKTRFTVARMAYWMKQNIQRGYDAPMDMVVQQVKEERAQLFSHEFADRTVDEIIQMAGGEDFIKKVRKFDLERIKQRLNPTGGTEVHTAREKPSKDKKTMRDVDAFFNDLRRTKR